MAPNNLIVAPLTPDDVPEYQAIRYLTFKPTINKILYTREPSQATLDRVNEETRNDLRKGRNMMSCRDATTGIMIAGANWHYHGPPVDPSGEVSTRPPDRTLEEVEAEFVMPEPYTETDPRCFFGLYNLFNACKREVMGTRPYFCLNTLVTHPDHQRRGAGGLLVKWGVEEADRRNIECYLEASPMGAPLYERYGFQKVKDIELDVRPFGYEDRFEFILMRRPARWEREQEIVT